MKYPANPLTPFLPTVPRNLFTSFANVFRFSPSFSPQPNVYPQPSNSCRPCPTSSVLSVPLWQIQSLIPSPRAPSLHNFGAPITTFRINTCISVASKRLYLPLESTLMKKGGGGGRGGRRFFWSAGDLLPPFRRKPSHDVSTEGDRLLLLLPEKRQRELGIVARPGDSDGHH